MKAHSTKDKILKEGRSLLQRHGYNGFSFQDIANAINIKKPSLYDHYKTKEDLILAILHYYSKSFDEWTCEVMHLNPLEQIRKVFDIFYSFSCDKRKVCPVLALTADTQILTPHIQTEMKLFISKWMTWLESQIAAGQKIKTIRTDIKPKILASLIYNQVMGSQFQARILNDPNVITKSGDSMITFIQLSFND